MKAISLIQPYATLIIMGYKQLETRSWQTSHRGNLAIHASAGKPDWAREVAERDPYIKRALDKHGLTFDALPRGAVIGTVGVRGMLPIDKNLVSRLSPLEFACGDYSMPGRFAWELFSAVPLDKPITCRGALSVWEVPTEVVQQIYPHATLSLD
jgi:hypothetical protein